jgi:radical SAM-linked protein
MQRIFKRARLETLHTEGYNLRPLLSFGPALTLGISSLTEYFDVRVPGEWKNFQDIMVTLQAHSEPGIVFKGITVITNKTPSIQDSAKAFKYFVPVRSTEKVNTVVSELKEQSEIIIKSYSKKEEKLLDKDIRPMILDMNFGNLDITEKELEIIDEVSPCRMPGIFVTTLVNQGSGIRPSEIIELLTSRGLVIERPIKVGIELNA